VFLIRSLFLFYSEEKGFAFVFPEKTKKRVQEITIETILGDDYSLRLEC
jgi:hypothetical protein